MGEADRRTVFDLYDSATNWIDRDPATDQEPVKGDAAHRTDPGATLRDPILSNILTRREESDETADTDTGFMGSLENADGKIDILVFYQGQVIDDIPLSCNRIEGDLHGIILDIVVDKLEREGHAINLLTAQ